MTYSTKSADDFAEGKLDLEEYREMCRLTIENQKRPSDEELRSMFGRNAIGSIDSRISRIVLEDGTRATAYVWHNFPESQYKTAVKAIIECAEQCLPLNDSEIRTMIHKISPK